MLGNPLRGSVGWAAVGRTGAERSGRRRVWEGEGVPCHALPRLHPGGWRRTRRRSQVRQVQAESEWSVGGLAAVPWGRQLEWGQSWGPLARCEIQLSGEVT